MYNNVKYIYKYIKVDNMSITSKRPARGAYINAEGHPVCPKCGANGDNLAFYKCNVILYDKQIRDFADTDNGEQHIEGYCGVCEHQWQLWLQITPYRITQGIQKWRC